MTEAPARIGPLPLAERDEVATQLLASVSSPSTDASNVFATLVRHPGLFRRWLPGAAKLLAGVLPPLDRELMILRTAWRCGAEYEWGHHVVIARQLGLADDDIDSARIVDVARLGQTPTALLLRAVDELHDDNSIGDATWAKLTARFDERQLIELVMLVGQYHQVSYVLNTLGVQLEPGVEGFDTTSETS